MMKLVMTLLVRDEEDIILANLNYHLSAGIDHIYITDNLSTDSTRDLVLPFERDGVVTIIDEHENDYQQSVWVTRMAQLAHAEKADWVINCDADEFWWPTNAATLRKVFEGLDVDVGTLVVPRHDFPPIYPTRPGPFWEAMVFRKTESRNILGKPLPPKVAHRAAPLITVRQGNHAVSGLDGFRQVDDADIEILHFPIRSEYQFEQKVINGGRAYEKNTVLHAGVGKTWRYLYAEYQAGRLPDRYMDEAVLNQEVAEYLERGELVEDTRLRDRLRSLMTQ